MYEAQSRMFIGDCRYVYYRMPLVLLVLKQLHMCLLPLGRLSWKAETNWSIGFSTEPAHSICIEQIHG